MSGLIKSKNNEYADNCIHLISDGFWINLIHSFDPSIKENFTVERYSPYKITRKAYNYIIK